MGVSDKGIERTTQVYGIKKERSCHARRQETPRNAHHKQILQGGKEKENKGNYSICREREELSKDRERSTESDKQFWGV